MSHIIRHLHRYMLALLAVGLLILGSCSGEDAAHPRTADLADSISSDTISSTVSDSLTLTIVASDSATVLDLTRRHYDVDSRATALGAFVTAIDSVENSRRAFWVYSVNDSTPLVAADKQIVAPGDTVRWHLRLSDPTR